ncbi:hypothetical protein OHA77_38995 [Streptosporangium sp. NBC_01639]|uniref:hypothetical protein n=1 Tax=Streptosporangium sp. NBC_01639 TaxID=2975948 RepID=UPI0038648B99|nr:hypothetical protein OHA77_38995 [Streptosporangium sp. NBC_01639]
MRSARRGRSHDPVPVTTVALTVEAAYVAGTPLRIRTRDGVTDQQESRDQLHPTPPKQRTAR